MQDAVEILELWKRLMVGEYGARAELIRLQNHQDAADKQVEIADKAIKELSRARKR